MLDELSSVSDWAKFVKTLPNPKCASSIWKAMSILERARHLKICSESKEIAELENKILEFNLKNKLPKSDLVVLKNSVNENWGTF